MTLTWRDFYLPPINLWSAPKMKDVYDDITEERMMTEEEWDALSTNPNINGIDPTEIPALNKQIGGDHYKSMAIQPWEVMRAINTAEEYKAYHINTAIAYLMRHKKKGGTQDIAKAHHHLSELLDYLKDHV